MTRGNQREVDRARAQARAAKHKKASTSENKARAKQALNSKDIMRQKQAAADEKKRKEAEKAKLAEEKKLYVKFLKRELQNFYRQHAPENLDNLPKIMDKFKGKYDKLQKGLEKKYGDKAPDISWEKFQQVKSKVI
mmetsp:Transcript_29588/g.51958  ORF Transcript_29588/g.51958 Transcript_29588/m.51958 type:complete len:136 (+) Transcript_29588:41-448(+)|eukprot:CAMPEP_0197524198 /NCGR_PEP_ID=MMETSP1318-20131121/8934_1 /TAXON_ID=552666 /ORGANISM="Partenskyella glossopodia, Strain RCC365" /LENGTH=135 /DNA_ID=CAMNT_0043077089 /DNA_START=35 /DNA_END=442 /DNA_ORIENTATION=+